MALPALIDRPELEPTPWWAGAALPGLAGWLGWGIRGQFGHETGAMVPGGMIGFALSLTANDPELWRRAGLLGGVGAMAMSFGGTETYGQTLGLSMHADTRERTYWWGLLGCAIKGGAWYGLAGAYLGMAAGEEDYSPLELLALAGLNTGLWHLGVELLNRPHDPPERLPAIYFSDRYHLDDPNSKPRVEIWGGQWFALLGLLAYVMGKGDRTALIMGTSGILGGAAGFAGGQAIQAWGHFHQKPTRMGWWKVMETTFGLIGGTALGLGLRLARRGRPRLLPRARAPWWQRLLGLAAGTFTIGSHVLGKPWTDEGMDSMVVASGGLAAAFSCEDTAWLEALPLVNHYIMQSGAESLRERPGMADRAVAFEQGLLPVTQGLAPIALALRRLAEGDNRAAAALGLLAMTWAHTNASYSRALLSAPETDPAAGRPLPAIYMVEQVARGQDGRRGIHFVEAAFTVAAVGITALALWVLGRKRE